MGGAPGAALPPTTAGEYLRMVSKPTTTSMLTRQVVVTKDSTLFRNPSKKLPVRWGCPYPGPCAVASHSVEGQSGATIAAHRCSPGAIEGSLTCRTTWRGLRLFPPGCCPSPFPLASRCWQCCSKSATDVACSPDLLASNAAWATLQDRTANRLRGDSVACEASWLGTLGDANRLLANGLNKTLDLLQCASLDQGLA